MPDSARFDALLATKQSILANGTNAASIYEIVVDRGLAVIPQAEGAIVELREKDWLVYGAASGGATRLVGRRVELTGSFAGRSIATGKALICPDIEDEPDIDPAPYREIGMRALMTVPLFQQGQSLGALKFYSSQPFAFAARDLTAAELVASQLISGLMGLAERTAVLARHQSAVRFESITECLPQLMWTMTTAGNPTYANKKALDFLGLGTLQALQSNIASLIEPAHRHKVLARWSRASRLTQSAAFQCRIHNAQGQARWMLVHLTPVRVRGAQKRIDEWIGTATDIDEQKDTEAALQDSLRSRELLLYEVNHRVKNSLQIVTGLLALHASRISDEEARSRLLEARSQIGTIAQIHQAIYQTSQHDKVEFIGFLKTLARSFVGRDCIQAAKLTFSVPETMFLSIEQGVPIALVTSELIANVLKHGQRGVGIWITVEHVDRRCIVSIADDGPGLPADFDPRASGGLGMEIIFGLTQQAGGHVEIDRLDNGTLFRLILPLSD